MKGTVSRRIVISLVLAVALIFGLFLSLSYQSPRAVDAQSVISVQTLLLTAANNVTQAATTSPFLVQSYGVADCYAKVDTPNSGLQTATFTLQHGSNTGDFVTLVAFPAIAVDGASSVQFTTTALYGNYLKVATSLGNTNAVTYYVQCIAKNR